MRLAVGGDRFLIVRGRGEPDVRSFPPLPGGFNGWLYVREEHPNVLYYFNYMGERVPFCGNATRILGYLLAGGGDSEVEVWASGPKRVLVRGREVGIVLRPNVMPRGDHSVVVMDGVRHVVFPVSGARDYPLRSLYLSVVKGGMPYHVNIYEYLGGYLFVRTWEYGYPYEPLGCATGTLSSAADFILRRGFREVRTMVRSGDEGLITGDGDTFTMWHTVVPL